MRGFWTRARRVVATGCVVTTANVLIGLGSHQASVPETLILLLLVLHSGVVLSTALRSPWMALAWSAWGAAAAHAGATFWMTLVIPDTVTNANAWRAFLLLGIVALEVGWTTLAWALAMWAARQGSQRHLPLRLAGAWLLAWWAADVLRSSGWWGDPYGSLSIALLDAPGVRGWLPWIGADGVAALAVGLSVLPFVAWHRASGRSLRARWTFAAGVWLLPALLVAVAGAGLGRVAAGWTVARAHGLVVTAMQNSRDKRAPWTVQARSAEMEKLVQAIAATPRGGVVMAPETYFDDAVPLGGAPDWDTLPEHAAQFGVHAIVGIPLLGRDRGGKEMMNAVVHVAPQRQAIYAKERLVPGAEYIPWPALIQPLLSRIFDMRLKSQLSAPAELTQALYVDGHLIGVGICHELSFPVTMAERARDANMLVSVSEDNWIPSAAYRAVMWRVAQLRGAEAAKPLVRASNGMAAMWVDASGRMLPATAHPTELSASAEVLPRDGATPYHLTAWLQALAPLGLLLLLLAVGAWRWLQEPAGLSGQPHHREGMPR